MFAFPFVQDFTWLLMVISGFIGVLYSGEKVVSYLPFFGNTEDRNSKFVKYFSWIMAVIASIWLSLLILDDNAQFRWLTLVLLSAFIVVNLAHPVRSLEGWKVIIIAIPFIIIAILAFWFKNGKELSILGVNISLWVVLTIVAIGMLILFVLVFFVEETFVDPTLFFLGWSPVRVVVSLLVILQGISLLFNPIDGFLAVIGMQ